MLLFSYHQTFCQVSVDFYTIFTQNTGSVAHHVHQIFTMDSPKPKPSFVAALPNCLKASKIYRYSFSSIPLPVSCTDKNSTPSL